MAFEILQQADHRWHHEIVGFGDQTKTFGNVGCLTTVLTMACNFLRKTNYLPPEVNRLVKAAHGFTGASLIMEKAAPAVGLYAPEIERLRSHVGDPQLAAHAIDALMVNGGATSVAFLHVDHDNTARALDADDSGKHFILAYGFSDHTPEFICADPAPGAPPIFINANTMSGKSKWGSVEMLYRVVSVGRISLAKAV